MKKNRNLIFVFSMILVFQLGFSLAYYVNKIHLESHFYTPVYGLTVAKEFELPDEFRPGDTVNYDMNATNESDIDVALRVIVLPHWRGYRTLSTGEIFTEEYHSNYVSEGEYYNYYTGEIVHYPAYNLVDINYADNSDWIDGGYFYDSPGRGGNVYYYKYRLSPKQSTSNLFESLTFNQNAANISCTPTLTYYSDDSHNFPIDYDYREGYEENSGMQGVVCTTGYNSQYTFVLHLWIQTVQYDAYKDVWNTSVEIN